MSHAQAEDLTDRIRRRLTDAGTLAGTSITGPGWTTDRHYQAGDRMLLHTRHGDRHSPLVNGTVGTIDAVDDRGVPFRPDRGEPVRLPAGFIQGSRADGSPNVSHAWARTVDGAQGGTWDHAHLLGTAALDAYRGYTAQSRSVHPTHTWNTATLPTVDFGGRLAHDPDPEHQVAVALSRIPDTTMAAVNDPWTVDRRAASADRRPPGSPRPVNRPTDNASSTRPSANSPSPAGRSPPPKPPSTTSAATSTRSACSLPSLDTGAPNVVRSTSGCSSRQAAAIDAAGPVATAEARVERLHPRTGRPRPPRATARLAPRCDRQAPGNGSTSTGPTSRSPVSAPTRPSPTASNRCASAADTSPANSPRSKPHCRPTVAMSATARAPFQATLEPDGQGSHWLKVDKALREAAGVAAGDSVALEDARRSRKNPNPRCPPTCARH